MSPGCLACWQPYWERIIVSSQTTPLPLENVLYEKRGAIAYVTLNRPKVLNALNQRTVDELRVVFEDARDDSAVNGVILTGAGDKAFIAGADIAELAERTAIEAEASTRNGQATINLIENLNKPVIAAINGFALGGGCETAMACTIRLATAESKFGQRRIDSARRSDSQADQFQCSARHQACHGSGEQRHGSEPECGTLP
jgi:1,4-dihydroxy-2-naphthoyl-CoA synthase